MSAPVREALAGVRAELSREETVVRLPALTRRGVSQSVVSGPFHESRSPQGVVVTLASTDQRTRIMRLRVETEDFRFRKNWVRWVLPLRRATDAVGGSAADAQDEIADDGSVRVLLTPDEVREVTLAFEAPLDGVNEPGDYGLYVVVADEEAPKAGRTRLPLELRMRHPETSFMRDLPSIYAEAMMDLVEEDGDRTKPPFFERYLRGFEDSIEPLWAALDHMERIIGPYTAPARFLSFLAGWTAMPQEEGLSEMARRRYIAEAVALVRWRGTARGMRHLLRIVAGGDCRIDEATVEGMRLGSAALLNAPTTKLGNVGSHFFRVILTVPNPDRLDVRSVHRAIVWCKPAHTVYDLVVVPAAHS